MLKFRVAYLLIMIKQRMRNARMILSLRTSVQMRKLRYSCTDQQRMAQTQKCKQEVVKNVSACAAYIGNSAYLYGQKSPGLNQPRVE